MNEVSNEVAPFRSQVEKGLCIDMFGEKADQICNSVSYHIPVYVMDLF